MEVVAQLGKEFARIEIMSAAEGETVVEEHPAVGDVDGFQVDREFLTETLAKRKVKRGVRLEMIARDCRVAVGESLG